MNDRCVVALGRSLFAIWLASAAVACGVDQPPSIEAAASGPAPETMPSQDAAVAPVQAPPETDAGAVPVDKGFVLEDVAVSTVPLGEFPYFSIPEGYQATPLHVTRLDFGEVAFWTGDRFERIEGKVYAAGIRVDREQDRDKQFSSLEVARNLEHVVTAAGGVEVASGEIPRDARQNEAIADLMREYHTESRCWDHDPIQIFVIRREDANIWVRTCRSQRFAGLIVAQEASFVPTSRLLPVDELKRQLDVDGKVALQIHFAIDKADILPESQPQMDEVLRLLQEDPALNLEVNGHTDNTGHVDRNQALSEARARAVAAALTSNGIEAARLQAQGFGQSQPVADNGTEEGRAKNRRVELVKRH